MYIPEHFKEKDSERLADLINEYPFGMLVTIRQGLPFVSHIPFLYEQRSDGAPVLLGHVARANPQWNDLAEQTVLVVFQGPHAYVSPSWYKSPGVPTWNYAVVHIYGKARLIEDQDSVERLIGRLTAVHESTQPSPWSPNLSAERRAKLFGMIVGFEIEMQEIQGKFKLSQNRSNEDQRAVIAQLNQSPFAAGVAELMQRNLSNGS